MLRCRVKPSERFYFFRILAIAGNDRTVDMTTSLKGSETAETVGDDNAPWVEDADRSNL